MYCSDEQMKRRESSCEYPPRFQIICKQIGESESLSSFVLTKRLKNKETKCIAAFPLDKNATGMEVVTIIYSKPWYD